MHLCYKANASARERLDQSLVLAVVTDRGAHRADPATQGRLRDDPSLPKLCDELVSTDDTVTIAQKILKQIEDLWLNGHDTATAMQLASLRIQQAIVEEVVHAGLPASLCQNRERKKSQE